jgi:hypothetical protein
MAKENTINTKLKLWQMEVLHFIFYEWRENDYACYYETDTSCLKRNRIHSGSKFPNNENRLYSDIAADYNVQIILVK